MLTHHQILALVAPYTRQGLHVDLAHSDRLQGRLQFKPVQRAGTLPCTETLQLEQLGAQRFRLTRTLTPATPTSSDLQARLVAEGAQHDELLQRMQAVLPEQQLRSGPGFRIALQHRVAGSDGAPTLILTNALLDVPGLRLTMRVSGVDGYAAEIEIQAPHNDIPALPEDLLAVLGWSWGRLAKTREGWTSSLRLKGNGAARSRDAEAKLERTAAHLAQTLAATPGQFHDRHHAARWSASFRRGIPLAVCVLIVAAAAAVPLLPLAQDSVFRMLIFNAPPILLVVFFALREMPRFEFPPLPRRPTAAAWRDAPQPVPPSPPPVSSQAAD